MQLGTYVVIWSCLATIVLALALVRYLVSLHEDDNMHIGATSEALISEQMALYRTLEAIDRWGKTLTIVAVAAGFLLGALYLVGTFPG